MVKVAAFGPRLGVYSAFGESGVEAAPSSAVDRLQAQVYRLGHPARGQDRVRQLEEGVSSKRASALRPKHP